MDFKEKNQHTGGASGEQGFSGTPTPDATGGMVNVSHAMHNYPLPVAGMKVKYVRSKFTKLMNIDPEAIAVIDGNEVDDETVVDSGVGVLHFVKRSSVKG